MKITAQEAEKTFLNKVIRFNRLVEEYEIDFDTGMLARIKNLVKEDGDDCTYSLLLDYSEFETHNLPLMKANYYNKEGKPCETWAEQPSYQEDKKDGTVVYIAFEFEYGEAKGELVELPFDIVNSKESETLVEEYTKSKPTMSYVEWLEDELTRTRMAYKDTFNMPDQK